MRYAATRWPHPSRKEARQRGKGLLLGLLLVGQGTPGEIQPVERPTRPGSYLCYWQQMHPSRDLVTELMLFYKVRRS